MEWDQVVDAWQLESWESYRDVARLGRKTRLPEAQRKVLCGDIRPCARAACAAVVSDGSRDVLSTGGCIGADTQCRLRFRCRGRSAGYCGRTASIFRGTGGGRANALFFAGDLGQRIFQQPFSWKALGVDIRGRARTLRVNYRTSHQIRSQADRLLGPEVADADGNEEMRSDTVSVFNGPPPTVRALANEAEEVSAVGAWIADRLKEAVSRRTRFGIFVRSSAQLPRARAAAEAAGVALQGP